MLTSLIYVGVAADRATTFVDFDIEAKDPAERARGLLDEHRSSERVEVWRDDSCIAVVARLKMDPAI